MVIRPRRRDTDITEAEQQWAEGLPITDDDARVDLEYSTAPERLRFVWEQVHGEPIEDYLRDQTTDPFDLVRSVHVNMAIVGRLHLDAARALMLRLPFEWG